MMASQFTHFLAKVPLFKGAPERALDIAAESLQAKRLGKDDILFP